MSVAILRGDARSLPLPDASVDLIVTSPPFYGLRDYTDGGESLAGQIGSERTPQEYVAALLACTAEWVRVLKPEGSLFVNLGDKYGERAGPGHAAGTKGRLASRPERPRRKGLAETGIQPKSLMGLPWRYALGCMDDLGLILRAEIIWAKVNGLPESVTDRVRRSHEQVFHFTRQPTYYAAVDEIREAHSQVSIARTGRNRFAPDLSQDGVGQPNTLNPRQACNPLGKLPGSVWEIPSQPLIVPASLGLDHFAAFPMELPRRIIAGWSPPGICEACGEGRRPVIMSEVIGDRGGRKVNITEDHGTARLGLMRQTAITGYACRCTPHTDHPERRGKDFRAGTDRRVQGMNDRNGGERYRRYMENPRGPVREYHFDRWDQAPTRPAIVLDPFMGTGTSLLVASALGRIGLGVDRSLDYCRLAQWRTTDPAERAKAMQVPKPPPVPDGQDSLFDLEAS